MSKLYTDKKKTPDFDSIVDELDLDPKIKEKLKKNKKFFEDWGVSIDSIDEKKAYFNDDYMKIPGQSDTAKWMKAAEKITQLKNSGMSFDKAVNETIQAWSEIESYDFKNWYKYYLQGNHLKYKQAQIWFKPTSVLNQASNTDKLDIDDLIPNPTEPVEVVPTVDDSVMIKDIQTKVLARLNAAEKLLSSNYGIQFAGNQLDELLNSIHTLKRQVLGLAKKSKATKIYEDLIIREGNKLHFGGFIKQAEFLYKIAGEVAQTVPPTPPQTVPVSPTLTSNPDASGDTDTASPEAPVSTEGQEAAIEIEDQAPPPPTQIVGNPGALPLGNPDEGNVSPSIDSLSEGMKGFLSNMEPKVEDKEDELEIMDADDLVVEAQVQEVTPAEPIGVNDEELENNQSLSGFDSQMDQLFSNVTVQDIIQKLEDLAKVCKVREIPRQLSLIDMMLNALNMSPLFPSLSEATNKALESNNYISSRIEEILSKLRGTLDTNKIDLTNQNQIAPKDPNAAGVRDKLEQENLKTKERKEFKKRLENESLDQTAKQTQELAQPEIEVQDDLSQPEVQAPIEMPEATPAPVPAAKPIAPRV